MDSSSATAARLIGSRLPGIKRMHARARVRFPAGEMTDSTRSRLIELAQNVSSRENGLLNGSLPSAAGDARRVASHWAFEAPSRAVEDLIKRLFPGHRAEELNRIRVAVV